MILLDLPLAREYYSNLFHRLELNRISPIQLDHSEIARALVTGGFGFTILNIRPVDYEKGKSGYVVLPISDNLPIHFFGLATLPAVHRPRIVEAFVDHCTSLKGSGVYERMVVT